MPPLDYPLAGFLQGGALSLFTGVQLDQALPGIVVISGYLLAALQCKPKHLDVPIWWHGHGMMDLVMVQFGMAEKTKLGDKEYTLESFPIQHTVSLTESQKVMQLLAKILPLDDLCKILLKDPKEISFKALKNGGIQKAGLQSKAVGFMEKSEFVRLIRRDGKSMSNNHSYMTIKILSIYSIIVIFRE
jgi:hypothetical protein